MQRNEIGARVVESQIPQTDSAKTSGSEQATIRAERNVIASALHNNGISGWGLGSEIPQLRLIVITRDEPVIIRAEHMNLARSRQDNWVMAWVTDAQIPHLYDLIWAASEKPAAIRTDRCRFYHKIPTLQRN